MMLRSFLVYILVCLSMIALIYLFSKIEERQREIAVFEYIQSLSEII